MYSEAAGWIRPSWADDRIIALLFSASHVSVSLAIKLYLYKGANTRPECA
jgi:hypothetical protein